jgi:hypothetical protein
MGDLRRLEGEVMAEIRNANPTTTNQPRLRAALEKVRREAEALQNDDLSPIIIDPIAASVTARGAYQKLLKFRDRILALPDFHAPYLEDFETYVRAAYYAQTLLQAASKPPAQFEEVIAEAAKLRESLLSDARALVNRGIMSDTPLASLKGSVGFQNIASDLMTLTNMFRAVWPKLVGKTFVTEEELDRAEVLCDEVVNDLGQREQSPSKIEDVSVDRQKTFTLFVTAYDQLRRAITYIRWNEGDADEIAPSLYSGKKRRQVVAEEPTQSVSTTTTANAVATHTTNVQSTATATPLTGMPGGDPFTN